MALSLENWPPPPPPSTGQALARTQRVLEQIDLDKFGMGRIDVGGTTLFSVSGEPKLYAFADEAFEAIGMAVIISIDSRVFIEPMIEPTEIPPSGTRRLM